MSGVSTAFVRFEVLDVLRSRGLDRSEVYLKSGRSRRFWWRPEWVEIGSTEERGWAVRAGDDRCSFFASGTGWPRPDQSWPAPDGFPIQLPPRQDVPEWRSPAGLDAPLAGERDGVALLEAVRRALKVELPSARLVSAVLEDGASESLLANSNGVDVRWRHRVASIRLDALDPSSGVVAVHEAVSREASDLRPGALASALATRLHVKTNGRPPGRERADVVMAPEVGAQILTGITPLLVGPAAAERVEAISGRSGFASEVFDVVDDGRLDRGLMAGPVDGEGVPTSSVVLIEAGRWKRPLLSWGESQATRSRGVGCVRRASWRDRPVPGPTHLWIRPRDGRAPGELIESIGRGFYLASADGPAEVDFEAGRFALAVSGFELRSGVARAPVTQAVLLGQIGSLLRGIQAVGRDVRFFPLGGMIGSPSLLVSGLEVRAAGARSSS